MDGWAFSLPPSAQLSALFFSSFPRNDSAGAGGPNALISIWTYAGARSTHNTAGWMAGWVISDIATAP